MHLHEFEGLKENLHAYSSQWIVCIKDPIKGICSDIILCLMEVKISVQRLVFYKQLLSDVLQETLIIWAVNWR